jgi:hypothetical protein
MNLKRLTIQVVLSTFLLITTVITTVNAQQLKSEQAPARPRETGLALEITYLKGAPPSYHSVPWVKPGGTGSWFGRFGVIKDWHFPVDEPPINAVRIISCPEGDKVSITVSLLRGKEVWDVEQPVGTYLVAENEKLSVDALKAFGLEPFGIRVIRMPPQTSEVPSIVNNTKSVEVTGIEPLVSTFPSYKIGLHNLSDKNISAIRVYIMIDGRRSVSWMPQGKEAAPLIKAGGSNEVIQSLSTKAQAVPGGYMPTPPGAQQILIASLVFEDGTYEGEENSAATHRAFAVGYKTGLKRVLPVLETALATSVSPESFRAQINAISYLAQDPDVAALKANYPGMDPLELKSAIQVAIQNLKKDSFDQLANFQQADGGAGNFKNWLTGLRDRYSSWLSRLP